MPGEPYKGRRQCPVLPTFAPLGLTILWAVVGLVFVHGERTLADPWIAATQDRFHGLGIPYTESG